MAKLTEKEREGFELIMKEDMSAVNAAFMQQIKNFWNTSRIVIEQEEGYDELVRERSELNASINRAKARIHEIESQLASEPLNPEQVVELGGNPNEYGKYRGANFYGIPVTGQFEYKIVEYIRKYVNTEIPSKFIYDLGRSCMRELTMSGTFEEARAAYEKFYSLDFRKYGVDIPPRLGEVKDNVALLEKTQETLMLGVNKKGELE